MYIKVSVTFCYNFMKKYKYYLFPAKVRGMVNILLLGNGAREHALAEAIVNSPQKPRLFSYMKTRNPGIADLSESVELGKYDELGRIKAFAEANATDFAIIGPEAPLTEGVVDALEEIGIKSVGPLKELARLETSKSIQHSRNAKI
jgi:phosphoribosylamine--glycine ligase